MRDASSPKNHVLHRSLDIQGHSGISMDPLGAGMNETYQDEHGHHLWTIKRFHGEAPTDPTDTNPEEVEKEHHEP
ncbi:hypothetical protein [Paenarthrobacter sp. NPDC018779]|uniref:hypothetical protein n=1 Tax=Paenarthrobacter sp. NPDC018779 TaxID=3364375 RepID=UPI0037CB3B0F